MSSPGPADPRTIITPDSFTVATELLGMPLARPWRRAVAMLVDLMAVALLANAGGVFLAFGAAFALWRASAPARGGLARTTLRLGAALALFVAVVSAWGALVDRDGGDDASASVDRENLDLGMADLQALPAVIALTTSTDTTEIRQAARDIAARIGGGDDVEGRREAARALLEEVDDPQARDILRAAIAAAAPRDTVVTAGPAGDSAVILFADALARGDTAAARSLRPGAVGAVAGDSIARIERQAQRLRESSARLEGEVRDMEDRRSGFMGFLRNIADDLGIGFGWGALYFTAFLALWRGQTPGKRLLGMRVIRLDGKPIGWWIAFERFGSYAASLSTGLLGFAQILWDRNRQGLHDKAVETVVIRDLPASIRSEGTWRPAVR